jgi:hypothetical protein
VKKLAFLISTFALLVASAASSHRITLTRPSVVNGTELKAGEYRLNLDDAKATLVSGKTTVEVPVKIENADSKFGSTAVRYAEQGGKSTISEIRLGGTKTRVVFAE